MTHRQRTPYLRAIFGPTPFREPAGLHWDAFQTSPHFLVDGMDSWNGHVINSSRPALKTFSTDLFGGVIFLSLFRLMEGEDLALGVIVLDERFGPRCSTMRLEH